MIHPGGPPSARPATDLVQLDRDHPGFRDPEYRTRRNAIARVAIEYRGGPVPEVEYSEAEQAVWRQVWERLSPLHGQWACRELLEADARLALDRQRIPQLAQLNPALLEATGFELEPVAGLVTPRTFLVALGRGAFLSTQYIRHASAPFYTPEPDVVHELIGHAASLLQPEIAALTRDIGRAASTADDQGVRALIRIYWYTLEFGAVEERGAVKALGAGLLSSAGEIERLGGATQLLTWDLARIAETDFDPTHYQPGLFVAPSFARLVGDVREWIARSF